ncbi:MULTISPECIES: DUF1430 domain-containing protein [unclassified Lactococcus]|uniref:DUF1430 domain-containing protein n=1 Tax=unclassified Lactococcus TaxID=2643510 RepID=UPI0011CA7667|nr:MULTISPECIES: DUF1430 domain-containing protein [unclassified Lactococcus]MQW22924.1 DUF1430 domain-containing protein [Lactococcus sp. dk101]TXK44529.1 DUF1430 domain-containing protein [Lactococcus sp. dk310]TXK50382.1 DUF1430 domain-containing protein [Lactococcus sp. dk322]
MYKILQNNFIVVSLSVIMVISVGLLNVQIPGMMGGNQQTFVIVQTKGNVKNELLNLAEAHHVSFAKRFVLPDSKASEGMSYTYEQIGDIKLPSYLPLQKSKAVIKESPDTTNYVVVGKGYTARQAATDLSKLGNQVSAFSLDNSFTILKEFIATPSLWFIFLVLLFIYIALLLAEYISVIKKTGIERLSGYSRKNLAFKTIRSNIVFVLVTIVLCTGLGSLYFLITANLSLQYIQTIFTPIAAWGLLLVLVTLFIAWLAYISFQRQPINLAVKGKAPLKVLTGVMITFQMLTLFVSIASLSNLLSTNQTLKTLSEGQAAWAKNKSYYGMVMTNMVNNQDFINFLLPLLEKPDTLLVANQFDNQIMYSNGTFGQNDLASVGYHFSPYPDQNLLTVNENFLKKEHIQLPSAVEKQVMHLGEGQEAFLVPQSQSQNFEQLTKEWVKPLQTWAPDMHTISSLYTSPQKQVFAYSMFGITGLQLSDQSFAKEPLLVVYGAKTFTGKDAKAFTSVYQPHINQILVSNPSQVLQMMTENHLTGKMGGLYNGYNEITVKVDQIQLERNTMVVANVLGLLSAGVLVSLLNSVYFYQNRRKFLIEQLAGKNLFKIHQTYLLTISIALVLMMMISFLIGLPLVTFNILLVYLLMMGVIFSYQLRRQGAVNILYLKGE